MSESSYNDNVSHHTDKESQVPLVPSRARSNDEISYNSPSPVNVTASNLPTVTGLYASGTSAPQNYKTDRKEITSFYSPLAFKDDTMFTGSISHNPLSGIGFQSSSHSEPHSVSSMGSNRNEKLLFTVLCQFCGQFHGKNSPHLYDYSEQVDSTLLCLICSQPLVEPIEANCGHTFCKPCLDNHLQSQILCPDDENIINQFECKEPPVIVKKLLDNLKVVCPNVDYCEEVLYRHELYDHLRYKCRGAVIPCINAPIGCTFQGSRNSFSTHQWECKFKNAANGRDPIANNFHQNYGLDPNFGSQCGGDMTGYNNDIDLHDNVISAARIAVSVGGGGTDFDNGVGGGLGCGSGPMINSKDLTKMQIVEGTPTEIEICRINQCDLGFSFVGGIDSPLGCIIIQEVYLDGLISQDGRLRPGDELRTVNDVDLSIATHAIAKRVLSTLTPRCRLVVYREKAPSTEQETFSITLCRKADTQLGIVLDKKKNHEGIYIRNIIPNSEAYINGRLLKGDRILNINSVDMTIGSQEQAARIIKEAKQTVSLVVQRRVSVPDVIKTTDDRVSLGSWSTSSAGGGGFVGSGSATSNNLCHTLGRERSSGAPHSELLARRHLLDDPAASGSNNAVPLGRAVNSGFGVGGAVTSMGLWSSSEHNSPSFKSSPDHPSSSSHQSHQGGGGGGGSSGIVGMGVGVGVGVGDNGGYRPCMDRQITQLSDNYQALASPLPCVEDYVRIYKDESESLSITVAGGLDSQRGNVPIYVTNIYPSGVLSRYKKVQKGSVLVAINNQSLLGLQHRMAVETLKRQCYGHREVTLHYINGTETSSGAGNFMPSWKFWLQLPSYCAYCQIVELYKDNQSVSLGFSIVGGYDCTTPIAQNLKESMGHWSSSIMIKTILPNSIAFNNGKLKCGDILLEVNNYPLTNVSHSDAVKILKKTLNRVTLKIVSWPGTIV